MGNRLAEMVRAFSLQLEAGRVSPDDQVLILCSTDNYPPLVEAYFSAVAGLGAEPHPRVQMHRLDNVFGTTVKPRVT